MQEKDTMHATATNPALSRRGFMSLSAAALSAAALAGCSGGTDAAEGSGSDAGSAADSSEGTTRIGMEAAYAPFNWQTDEETEYTIPIYGMDGAYADGYDVQIGKHVCEDLGTEAVAVKMSFDGLIDALNNGTIDLIIAGMAATDERRESIDFSDPYYTDGYGLMVLKDSEFADATSLSDFSGAAVLGQKGTVLDTIIDDIPDVNHMTPVANVPAQVSALNAGTCDAITYNLKNVTGLLRSNPDFVAVEFAEGEGFQEEVSCSIGVAKGQDELLQKLNDSLAELTTEDEDEMWDEATDRQPA